MQASEVSELKQQGALEAARDPNSSVSAAAAEKKVVAEAKAAGGAAFQFDPDSTAEEKAAQLNASIPSQPKSGRKPKASAVVTDTHSAPNPNLPPPSTAGALPPPNADDKDGKGQEEEDEEWWQKVGWAPRFGDGVPTDLDMSTTLADHQTWVEERLDDKFFGDWYHNAGIIIFSCLSSWVIAILGGGIGWIILLIAVCGTYYRTSIRRVRRNFRDDVQREMAKQRLETDAETLEWINSFLVKFWPIYAPVLCKTIVMSVDQVLSTTAPPMVESLKMKVFTLGTKPPRLEHVKTYPKTDDDIVLMDWKFSFTPNDTADMTARQLKVKQNPKVVLEVRIGKGVVSKGLDVIVEDMACSGLMRVKVKLQIPFPHIDRVEVCFLERPTIDYVCKPLGGDTFGFDINFIPGLESFIMEQIHSNLAPMFYAPNVFPVEIAKMLAGTPVDQAIGVVQITFHGAKGLKNPDQFSGTPDPYALVKINDRTELGRTKTVPDSANPRWNETINIIVSSLKDTLNISVFDFNDIRKDRELGQATFALERLEQDVEYENEHLELTLNGKARGIVETDVRYFPVLENTTLQDGTVEPAPESVTGIARFTVEQAKDLDGTKSMIGLLSPYAVLLLNGKEIHVSQKLKRTNNPVWSDAHKEILITNRTTAKLGLLIKDDRELAADPIIGSYQIKVDDMLELAAKGQEWFNLHGVKTGRAKMMLQWRPVALKGGLGSGGYLKPIGVMRLHFQNARDLRNVETVGKSDPYVRVLLSGVQKGRTVTWKNNLNPDWDEVIYVPVHSTREKLTVEVMDEENMGRDRSLGHLEILLADYIHQESGEYVVHDAKKPLSHQLQSGSSKSPKGMLNYFCSFFPIIPTVDPDDEEKDPEVNGTARTSGELDVPRKSTDSKSSSVKRSLDAPRAGDSKSRSLSVSSGSQKSSASKDIPKIKLTPNNLVDYGGCSEFAGETMKSGLLIFTFIEGDLATSGCYLEVLIDDMVFPSYSSNKVKAKHHEFNETGDAMIRELDQSMITLRLIEHQDHEGSGSEDHVLAKLTGPTLQTLQRCLYTPTTLTLRDEHGRESRITVKLKFIPVKMKLDPSESFNNMGKLRVDLMDATDLPAADRSGYSDPYCKFFLDGKEVYKSNKINKTLNPQWNEQFETSIRSRTAAKFEVQVFDWDFGNNDDFLGKAAIDLTQIEPFQRKQVKLPLDGKSGSVRLRLVFAPEYITRARQGSSTFHGTFAAAGKIGGAPVKTIGKGATTMGGGVAKAGSFLGKSFRRRKSQAGSDFERDAANGVSADLDDAPPLPDKPSVSIDGGSPSPSPMPGTPHSRGKSFGIQSAPGAGSASAASPLSGSATPVNSTEIGTATLQVVSATGFPPSANVRVHIKQDGPKHSREVHKTKAVKASGSSGDVSFPLDDSCKLPGVTGDAMFRLVVKDHSTWGSDDELGEVTFSLPLATGTVGELPVKVGSGKVLLRWRWEAADRASVRDTSSRGVLGKGWKRDSRDRSVTPGV